jgi:hypothetical protein
VLKPTAFSALKLKYNEPLSNFAFNFNLRRYIMELQDGDGPALPPASVAADTATPAVLQMDGGGAPPGSVAATPAGEGGGATLSTTTPSPTDAPTDATRRAGGGSTPPVSGRPYYNSSPLSPQLISSTCQLTLSTHLISSTRFPPTDYSS